MKVKHMIKEITKMFIVYIVLCVFSIILALPFVMLWNIGIVAAITTANTIGYWEAYTILCLLSLLASPFVRVASD